MTDVPKIRIISLSGVQGEPSQSFAAVLYQGDNVCARIEFEVEAPQSLQDTGFDVVRSKFRRVLEDFHQAEYRTTDERLPYDQRN